MSPYVSARVNPFSASAHALPDGQNQNFICVDYHVANSLTSLPSQFVIQTIPSLPAMAAIASTAGAITVDGVVQAVSSAYTPSEITASTTWCPLAILPPLANFYGALGGITPDPFNATKARFVVCGYKIIYTGPVSTCAGSITVTPNNLSMQPASITTTSVAAAGTNIAVQNIGNDGVTVRNYATQNATIHNVELQSNAAALTKESKTFRPEETVLVLPRYLASINNPTDMFSGSYPIVGNVGSLNGPLNLVNFFRSANVNPNGVIWYDDNWEAFQIVFNGINADASYRIETVVCLEMTLQQNSVYAPLAKEKSPYIANEVAAAKHLNSVIPTVMTSQSQMDIIKYLPSRLNGRTGPRATTFA